MEVRLTPDASFILTTVEQYRHQDIQTVSTYPSTLEYIKRTLPRGLHPAPSPGDQELGSYGSSVPRRDLSGARDWVVYRMQGREGLK